MAFPHFIWRAFLGLLIATVFLTTVSAQTWENSLTPHVPGTFAEFRPMRVHYGFGWNGITAATAEIQLSKTPDGNSQIDATGNTIGVARSLWKFDVTHVAVTDSHTLRPILLRETEMVRSKKVETKVDFTPSGVVSKRNETRDSSTKSKTRQFDFPNLHSIDSALLYLRSQPLKPDAVQRIVVYPATSAYVCTITSAGRDHITIPTGSYDAIKLDLQLDKIGKNRELQPHKKFHKATVWLSDDQNRLVLRIEAQIFLGTVFAELQSVQFADGKP